MSAQKGTEEILKKLMIQALNPMQLQASNTITRSNEIVLLSPTGTGKTLAFLLPIIAQLDSQVKGIQAMVIVPSRELAIQIEQVVREMGTGYKVNAMYGGQSAAKDKQALVHPPALLIGTPGRIASHLDRELFDVSTIKTLVLDEFDKSLEIGFDDEMIIILEDLVAVQKKVLTSATYGVEIPDFVGLKNPVVLDFLGEKKAELTLKTIPVTTKTKDETLIEALQTIGNETGIIFCNYKDSIQHVSNTLNEHGIDHGCFHGDMEQRDRERTLIKFRNGTHQLLLATDLAARGIDIPTLKFIMHYQLPYKEEEFIHRNGRTARMHEKGTAYVLRDYDKNLPSFIPKCADLRIDASAKFQSPDWKTLFISGGRKDKISKGDLAGLFFKQGQLKKEELGIIELKQDCAFVAVKKNCVKNAILKTNNTRLKKKKVRVVLI